MQALPVTQSIVFDMPYQASQAPTPFHMVWGRLRKDLASREFEDLKHDKVISTHQFKQRVAQLLHSYSLKGPGEEYSYLEKLVRGMPARLLRSKKNKYGPCGK